MFGVNFCRDGLVWTHGGNGSGCLPQAPSGRANLSQQQAFHGASETSHAVIFASLFGDFLQDIIIVVVVFRIENSVYFINNMCFA